MKERIEYNNLDCEPANFSLNISSKMGKIGTWSYHLTLPIYLTTEEKKYRLITWKEINNCIPF